MLSVWKGRYKTCFPSKLIFSFATNKKNHMFTQDGPDFQKRWELRKIKPSLWKPSLSHSLRNRIRKISNRYQNQAHNDSNACRKSLWKRRATILKCDILNYLCFTMLLGSLYTTCRLWWAATLSPPKWSVYVLGWVSLRSGLMGWLLAYYSISYPPLLGFKKPLASYAENRWYSPCSERRALIRHHWAKPPAARLKYHPSFLPMGQSFLHDKWHFTGMTEQQICTRQGCIWDRLTSRCMSREISFDCLLHLSHSLAWGLIEFQGAAQETGKRNSLGSYVQVFYASKEKYIGGIILTKHRTSDTGWNFHKR